MGHTAVSEEIQTAENPDIVTAEPQTGDGEDILETESEPDFKPEDIEPGDTVSTMSNEEADNLFKEKTNPKGGKDGLPF